ncbi:MAG: peptidase S1 [Hyphomonadaceae bacterium]|nr:peptidase S1 [Hyphomonadaceae bacterium]
MAALACVVTPAVAQNISANPTYGTYNLSGGFQPDPTNVRVSSGGNIDASSLGNGCTGFIASAPDVRLNYEPGSLPLIISVNSSADTSLAINLPNGQWLCDDDSGNRGMNPSITLRDVQSGQYDIWVGTYGETDAKSATLSFSELSSY